MDLLIPFRLAQEKGLTAPAYQNRMFREHAKYLAFGKNPEQYVQYVCGRPCLFGLRGCGAGCGDRTMRGP